MAYECQKFENGQLLTAACLNRMERGIEEAYSGSVVSTVCGTAIHADDSSGCLLQGLRLFGKATQADATPTNPVALERNADTTVILGGKNLWSNDAAVIKDGGNCWTATETGFQFRRGDYEGTGCVYMPIPIHKDQTLHFSCNVLGDLIYCSLYGDTLYGTKLADSTTGEYSFTADQDYPGAVVALILSGGTDDTDITNIQVTFWEGESFVPGKPLRILETGVPLYGIPMQAVCTKHNYTDKNGQKWFTDEIDFARGVYIQRCFTLTFDGTEGWTASKSGKIMEISGKAIPALNNFDTGTIAPEIGICAYFMCSHYKAIPHTVSPQDGMVRSYGTANGHALGFYASQYASTGNVDGWKQWLADQAAAGTPLTVVLGMKEPVETELSEEVKVAYAEMRTNAGDTAITNTACAYMEVSYVADTKLYIDKKFNELAAAIVNNV